MDVLQRRHHQSAVAHRRRQPKIRIQRTRTPKTVRTQKTSVRRVKRRNPAKHIEKIPIPTVQHLKPIPLINHSTFQMYLLSRRIHRNPMKYHHRGMSFLKNSNHLKESFVMTKTNIVINWILARNPQQNHQHHLKIKINRRV